VRTGCPLCQPAMLCLHSHVRRWLSNARPQRKASSTDVSLPADCPARASQGHGMRYSCTRRSAILMTCWLLLLLLVGPPGGRVLAAGAVPAATPSAATPSAATPSAAAAPASAVPAAAAPARAASAAAAPAGAVTARTPAASPSAPTPALGAPRARPSWGWPLPGRPEVTRAFDPPATRYGRGHRGVDLAGAPGLPVLAAGRGIVAYAGPLAGRGVVSVRHPNGLRTTYEPVLPRVRVGQVVKVGALLGTLAAGHLGCPRPACLHWGLLRGDVYLNPLSLFGRIRVRLLPLGGRGGRADAGPPPSGQPP
jgi:Peptidase family M23